MAGDDTPKIETGEASTASVSAEFGTGDTPKVEGKDGAGLSMEFGNDGEVSRSGEQQAPEADTADEPEVDTEDEGEEEDDTSTDTEDTSAADLGEWDPESKEAVAKFDGRFISEDGATINFEAFGKDLEANLAEGKADLTPAVRAYAKDRFGVSDDFLDSHIAGQLALREANDAKFYGIVGGKENYEAKLEWAKDGYTADQKAKFNAALKKGGADAEEQLELLNARFEKAQGTGKKPPVWRGKRPASPAKDATATAPGVPGGGVQPFANSEEHRKAQNEAMKSGDKAKIAEVRKRLTASTFWRGGQ